MSKLFTFSDQSEKEKKSHINQLSDLEFWAGIWRRTGTFLATVLILILSYSWYTFVNQGGSFTSLLFKVKPEPLFNIKDVLIGVSGLIAIFATAWRYKLHEIENLLKIRDAEIKERDSTINDGKRLDEQFAKAVELLKESNDISVRRGGVYILKNLATKSPSHVQQCIDMLCSLNNWMSSALQEKPDFFIAKDSQGKQWARRNLEINTSSELANVENNNRQFVDSQIISREVLKIVVDIIKTYSFKSVNKENFLDLSGYNLCAIELKEIQDLSFVKLQYVNLHGASIKAVNFDKCDLSYSNFSNSSLWHCSMREANLTDVNLQGASLVDIDLRCAELNSASAIGVDLNNCSLLGADLRGGNFKAGLFKGVQMQGADVDAINVDFNITLYENTTFDGLIFYESCFTGASFYGIEPQELLYFHVRDDLKNKNLYAIVSDRQFLLHHESISSKKFVWSEQSSRKLLNIWERYQKSQEQQKFNCDDHFEVEATLEDIAHYWVDAFKQNSVLLDHFRNRVGTLDPDLDEVMDDVLAQFKEKIKKVV